MEGGGNRTVLDYLSENPLFKKYGLSSMREALVKTLIFL